MAKTSNKTKAPDGVMLVDGKPVDLSVAGYKVGKRYTTALLSLTHTPKIAFQVEGEMAVSDNSTKATDKDKPMTLVPVMLLETGEYNSLIVPTVLESAFKRVPGGYVGKKFLAVQGGKKKDKRYFEIELFELEGA